MLFHPQCGILGRYNNSSSIIILRLTACNFYEYWKERMGRWCHVMLWKPVPVPFITSSSDVSNKKVIVNTPSCTTWIFVTDRGVGFYIPISVNCPSVCCLNNFVVCLVFVGWYEYVQLQGVAQSTVPINNFKFTAVILHKSSKAHISNVKLPAFVHNMIQITNCKVWRDNEIYFINMLGIY